MLGFFPVLMPLTIVCILINAIVSSIPAVFMQNIISKVEQNWQHGEWSVVGPQILRLVTLLVVFYLISLVAASLPSDDGLHHPGHLEKAACKDV